MSTSYDPKARNSSRNADFASGAGQGANTTTEQPGATLNLRNNAGTDMNTTRKSGPFTRKNFSETSASPSLPKGNPSTDLNSAGK